MFNPAATLGGIIGFFIGLFFFRSIFGALIMMFMGRTLGAMLGRNNDQNNARFSSWFSGWGYNPAADGPAFMETLFSMLGRLAAADGRVSPQEEELFRSVVINELRITDPQSVASSLEIFHRAAYGTEPMSVYARRAAETFRNRPQLLEMMLIIMIRVSAAKGSLHPEEDRLMAEAASLFGFQPGAYQTLKARYMYTGAGSGSGAGAGYQGTSSSSADKLKEAYSVLGVAGNAPEQEVRRAYRKKAAEYHPDKIAAKGLPKEFTELANVKFQEIQKAWELIRETRGF